MSQPHFRGFLRPCMSFVLVQCCLCLFPHWLMVTAYFVLNTTSKHVLYLCNIIEGKHDAEDEIVSSNMQIYSKQTDGVFALWWLNISSVHGCWSYLETGQVHHMHRRIHDHWFLVHLTWVMCYLELTYCINSKSQREKNRDLSASNGFIATQANITSSPLLSNLVMAAIFSRTIHFKYR